MRQWHPQHDVPPPPSKRSRLIGPPHGSGRPYDHPPPPPGNRGGVPATPKMLTSFLKSTTDTQSLCELAYRHAALMNHIHVSVAFSHLAHLCKNNSDAAKQPEVQQLLQHLTDLLQGVQQDCDFQGLSNIIWASGMLGHRDAMPACAERFLTLVHTVDSTVSIAQVLVGCTKGGHLLTGEQMQQLLAAFIDKQQQVAATPMSLSNMLWSVATMLPQVAVTHADILQQLQQLLAAFVSRQTLIHAKPSDISAVLWAVATMGQEVSPKQLQLMLGAFSSKQALPHAPPEAISQALWAVATLRQPPAPEQLHHLVGAFCRLNVIRHAHPLDVANALWAVVTLTQQLPDEQLRLLTKHLLPEHWLQELLNAFIPAAQQAEPRAVLSALLAAADVSFFPEELLAAVDCNQEWLQTAVPSLSSVEMAIAAFACGKLGYSSKVLPGALLHRAAQHVLQDSTSCSIPVLSTLCWSAAVLDTKQHFKEVLQLANALSLQWSPDVRQADMRQLFQVHLWLLDRKLPSVGRGLLGVLTQQQLKQCRAAWHSHLTAAKAKPTQLQRDVFAALQQLPESTWSEPPVMCQRTLDWGFDVHIAATTAAGLRVAFQVLAPQQFLEPDRVVNGPTRYQNRAIAARGYCVISIPYWEWNRLSKQQQQQQQYLMEKLNT